jgi:hypothetical protein
VADARQTRRQLRTNGELLLRVRPPAEGGSLRPVENSTWSEHWTAFYEQHPGLRPRLERSETFPREGLREKVSAWLTPHRDYVLVVSMHGQPDAVGVAAATVAGTGAAVADYVVGLVESGREGLFVLDEPAGRVLLVDQDQEEDPGMVLIEQHSWPEIED